ncbi:unnamed protein product [Closterium sp. NIES-53]
MFGLHLPSFSAHLVSTAALQDAMVTTTTHGGSNLYTLATEPPQVAASAQVSASGQVAASCLCCLLSHQTLLWHHRLGYPSMPRFRGMHSRLLVSGLPTFLPPLPPSPAPPYIPCIEGRQRAAPHSSSFPPTTAPLQTLHMDLCERFGQDLPVQCLLDRGGEFSSNLLRDFCHGEGILQSFRLPDSPQQNGIAERRIGLVMKVAHTSIIHAAAPHFLWPFAVRYAAHQLNLWPRVSLPETSPTQRWTGEVGDVSVFWVWGSRALVHDMSAGKLSPRAIPCVFLGFVPDALGWQFYHPTSRHVFPSQDVTFDDEQSDGLTERCKPASRPLSPVRIGRRIPSLRPPPVPGMHAMTFCPSFIPLRVPLPAPPESSLPTIPDPKSDCARAASPTVSRLFATAVIDPSFESASASALVVELLDFAAACRLNYTTALVAESTSSSPPSVGGECALSTDVLEDRQEDFECLAAAVPSFASMLLAPEGDPDAPDIPAPRSYAEAITGPYSSQWQAAIDAEMASWKSTGTYVDEVLPPRANIVNGMWIFRASVSDRGLTWLPAGTQWSLRRTVYGLCQAPRKWHDTLRTTLAALQFAPATADPSVFLHTGTSLPPFYVLVYVNDLIFATAYTAALTLVKSELQKRHTCTDLGPSALRLPILLATAHSSVYQPCALRSTFGRVRMGLELGGRGPVVLTGHADASWVDDSATQWSSQGYTFSLGFGYVSWRSTRSSSVLSSSCEAEIYAGAMAAPELRWLTYLLIDLGEQPRSPPVLYVDNKAMIALCQEHRQEYRTKHIALRCFLA